MPRELLVCLSNALKYHIRLISRKSLGNKTSSRQKHLRSDPRAHLHQLGGSGDIPESNPGEFWAHIGKHGMNFSSGKLRNLLLHLGIADITLKNLYPRFTRTLGFILRKGLHVIQVNSDNQAIPNQ